MFIFDKLKYLIVEMNLPSDLEDLDMITQLKNFNDSGNLNCKNFYEDNLFSPESDAADWWRVCWIFAWQGGRHVVHAHH